MKYIIAFSILLPLVFSCSEEKPAGLQLNGDQEVLSSVTKSTKEDASYWFGGNAEITSYSLKQARYGEIHTGTAVFVFVTEPFSQSLGTKSDTPRKDNVQVLKLNHSKVQHRDLSIFHDDQQLFSIPSGQWLLKSVIHKSRVVRSYLHGIDVEKWKIRNGCRFLFRRGIV